jgi:hypothetical protein
MRPREPHSSTPLLRSSSFKGDLCVHTEHVCPEVYRTPVSSAGYSPRACRADSYRPVLPALPYFLPGGADQPFPYPVGKADPCQGGGLSDEHIMLGSQTNADGC